MESPKGTFLGKTELVKYPPIPPNMLRNILFKKCEPWFWTCRQNLCTWSCFLYANIRSHPLHFLFQDQRMPSSGLNAAPTLRTPSSASRPGGSPDPTLAETPQKERGMRAFIQGLSLREATRGLGMNPGIPLKKVQGMLHFGIIPSC